MERSVVLALAAAIGLGVWTKSAEACSPVGNPAPPATPPLLGEDRLPGPVTFSYVTVTRGRGSRGGCVTSCDDIGSMGFAMALPPTQRFSPCDFGYRVKVVGGSLPVPLSFRDAPIGARCAGANDRGTLLFFWGDGAHDNQDPFSVTLEVTPLDGRGFGHPATVEISHDGRDPGPGGCGNAGRDAGATPAPPPGDAGAASADAAPEAPETVALSSRSCGCTLHPPRALGLGWLAAIGLLILRRRRGGGG